MLSFNEYLLENKSTLHVFDVDDTLVHSKAMVHVKNSKGETTHKLTPSEYNTHELPHGHHYDYHEFRSSDVFKKTSHPIKGMIRTINAAQSMSKRNPKNKTVINTARADFDDKHKFLGTLKAHGIHHIDKIHVHRAGNIPGSEKPEHKKLTFIRQHLDKHPYSHVKMYDDSKPNLNAFLGLKKEYPKTRFTAYHVGDNGKMSVHGKS
jgi:hypothetical protein